MLIDIVKVDFSCIFLSNDSDSDAVTVFFLLLLLILILLKVNWNQLNDIWMFAGKKRIDYAKIEEEKKNEYIEKESSL